MSRVKVLLVLCVFCVLIAAGGALTTPSSSESQYTAVLSAFSEKLPSWLRNFFFPPKESLPFVPAAPDNRNSSPDTPLSIHSATSTAATTTKDVPTAKPTGPVTSTPSEQTLVQDPEPTPQPQPLPVAETETPGFDAINETVRGALVNVLCETSSGSLTPISGSGVFIHESGVVLTNAHVAQYVLLEDSGRVRISCYIRTGSPAKATWTADVMYLSPRWIDTHASDLVKKDPEGTGEYDFALLRITGSVSGAPLPSSFPALPLNTSDIAVTEGVEALVAGYPAGFLGGAITQESLYPVTTITTIGRLYRFHDADTVDLVSLGGVILAQTGSSGGAVMNAQAELAALIATSSMGELTADRDLRAITLAHINREMQTETGYSLPGFIALPRGSAEQAFVSTTKPQLIAQLIAVLSNR